MRLMCLVLICVSVRDENGYLSLCISAADKYIKLIDLFCSFFLCARAIDVNEYIFLNHS